MAGDWIKMRGNLWDDPRVSRLCDLTDQSEAAIVGGLYWLWATADQHTEDGEMPGLTIRQIDRKTGVQGFGQALCDIGWLADHADGVRIINFEEHNGSSAKRRATDAQRKANSRTVSASDADNTRTDPGQKAPNLGAREEKRREEIPPTNVGGGGKRPSRKCPEDFAITEAMETWAKAEAPLVNIDTATAAFRDHTFKTAMTDWPGAWRNWLRKDQGYAVERQAKAGASKSTFAQQAADVARVTVPPKPGKDPTLIAIEEHEATVKPMSPEIRQALREAAERMRA